MGAIKASPFYTEWSFTARAHTHTHTEPVLYDEGVADRKWAARLRSVCLSSSVITSEKLHLIKIYIE